MSSARIPLLCLFFLVGAATLPAAAMRARADAPLPPEPPDLEVDADDAASDATPAAAAPAAAAPPPATYRMESLRHKIAHVLDIYRQRPLNTLENNPWEVMHWALAWGAGGTIKKGSTAGDLVGAFNWLNHGQRCNGLVMVAAEGGRLKAMLGKGMQGHAAQYLAVMAQARLPRSTPITVGGRRFTIDDLIDTEKRACREGMELTFTLISMAHYLDTDTTWTSVDGTAWSIPKLVEEELKQPIRGAPCGGSHRLFGLAYACQKRREAAGTLEGVYVQANRFYRLHQQRMFDELQNRDGSFSTAWFDKPEDGWDTERKLRTTGHMLEFLVSTTEQPVLYHPKTVKAVEYLAGILEADPEKDWKIGPMSHALHALAIYQERVWGRLTPHAIASFSGGMKARPQHGRPQSTAKIIPASLERLQSILR